MNENESPRISGWDRENKAVDDLVSRIKNTYPDEGPDFLLGYLKGILTSTIAMSFGESCYENTIGYVEQHQPLVIDGEII